MLAHFAPNRTPRSHVAKIENAYHIVKDGCGSTHPRIERAEVSGATGCAAHTEPRSIVYGVNTRCSLLNLLCLIALV